MIKRIFISTNTEHWDSLFHPIADCAWVERLNNFKINKILDTENAIIEVLPNIFLLLDCVENLPDRMIIDCEGDVLLHHTTVIKEGVKNAFTFKAPSQHNIDPNGMYRKVFEIMLGDRDNEEKQNDIITLFDYLDNEKIERVKTDFLYSIFNGKTETVIPKEITQTADIKDLHKYFATNKYNKQWDDEGSTTPEAEEQRKKLSLLKDALLAEK
jgi:hypothetical protein